MNLWRGYSTMAEFEREEIRPGFRIGFSLDDLDDAAFEGSLPSEEVDCFQLDSEGDEGDLPDGDDEDDAAFAVDEA